MPERTEENIERLVDYVVDSWDMDALVSYAKESLHIFYADEDNEEFNEDWEYMME